MRKNKIQITNPKNLHKNRQYFYDTILSYRNTFLNKKNGKYLSKYVENRNCPVCNSKKKDKIFDNEGSIFVVCKLCQMGYLDPVFKDKYLFDYYTNSPDVQANAHEKEKKFYNSIYSSGLEMIKKKKKFGKLLDLGCSGGFFLDLAKKQKWKTHGIEINKNEYLIASKKNHIVWNKEISKLNIKEKFDVVTLWDVFEHIKDPHKILKEIKKKLVKNGLIFMQIPSSDSIAAKILREKCNMFDPIEHVNLYNLNSLKKLFSITKFKIIFVKSVIDEVSVIKNFLNYDDPYLGDFKNSKKINFLSPELIHKNFQGYKLQILISPKK